MTAAVFTVLVGWLAAAPSPLLVVVEDASGKLDAAALRQAVAAELHRPVIGPGDALAPQSAELLLVQVSGELQAAVVFRRTQEPGYFLRRALKLSPTAQEAMAELALLAGNLARNEADELASRPRLPALSAPPDPPLHAEPEPSRAPPERVLVGRAVPLRPAADPDLPAAWSVHGSYGVGAMAGSGVHLFETGVERWWSWTSLGANLAMGLGSSDRGELRRVSAEAQVRFHHRLGRFRVSATQSAGPMFYATLPDLVDGVPQQHEERVGVLLRTTVALSLPIAGFGEPYLKPEVALPSDFSQFYFGASLGVRFWVF